MTDDLLLKTSFEKVVEPYTAGSPQQEDVVWTSLKPKEIQKKLEAKGFKVSYYIASQLLLNSDLRKRSYLKSKTMGKAHPLRNDQFEKIANIKDFFIQQGYPAFSIDTKKKELIGNFHRSGHYYDRSSRSVNDHDFESCADGKITPHGIYDLAQNTGYITLGTSKDTSAFICDNIACFWLQHGQWVYPQQDWMLLLCDGGGSNNATHYIVKQDFCKLAKKIKMNLLVAHYPPYCSKYNPIEHRLFSHLHHAWDGCILSNIQIAKKFAENTSTKTGLRVNVTINQKQYDTKRPVCEKLKSNMNTIIDFDPVIPQWNYAIKYQNVDFIF
ncbi:MAG: ISAzo13 family transposase [Calditrichaeota bacterium]|nr:ISAzo13 family transposase [Calditrichota bacterium]